MSNYQREMKKRGCHHRMKDETIDHWYGMGKALFSIVFIALVGCLLCKEPLGMHVTIDLPDAPQFVRKLQVAAVGNRAHEAKAPCVRGILDMFTVGDCE